MNINRACGMPLLRHCETACGVTWHSLATVFVPPRSSIILFASISELKHVETYLSRMLYPSRNTLRRMMTLAERITEAVEAAERNGYTVANIAQACGIKPQSVYQWLDGSTKVLEGPNLAELAELSGYRALWIAKEKGPRFDSQSIRQAVKLMQQMTPERQADAVKIITPLVESGANDAQAG